MTRKSEASGGLHSIGCSRFVVWKVSRMITSTSKLTPLGKPFRLRLHRDRQERTFVVCRCICGNKDVFLQSNIKKRPDMSCGCDAKKRGSENHYYKHGYAGTRTHRIWVGVVRRTTDTKHSSYAGYGAKGVTIDPSWMEFTTFLQDMGECPSDDHTIDRIDPAKGYSPENCRWLHQNQQAANRRCVHKIFDGEEHLSLVGFCRKHGVTKCVLLKRIRQGITDPQTLKQPSTFRGWSQCSRKRAKMSYDNAKRRCTKPCKGYYDRGIRMCDRWLSGGLSVFIDDMGLPKAGETLDRIDVNGDYCPENCRWLSRFEQASNKRNNRHITLDGATKTITQWARESGIPATTIMARLDRYHWTERDAVTIPVGVPKNPRSKGEKNVV